MEKRKFDKLNIESSLLGFGCKRFPLDENGNINEVIMEDKIIRNKIESLLFLWGEPLDISSISEAINLSKKETRNMIDDLIKEYEYRNTSLEIRCINDNYQIQTKKKQKHDPL